MKKYLLFILFFLAVNSAYANITYESLNIQAPYFSRLGTGNTPEAVYEEVKAETGKGEIVAKTIENTKDDLSLKDLNIKYLSNEISGEMESDSARLLSDLSILYNGAIQRSETIRYAIYKLSNPEEDKPNEGAVKKILKPIASFSSIAGTALSDNPYMATGALIGGSLIGAMTSDDKKVNYKFTKVNDADMVVLVRKIDELQKKLLFLYMDYVSNKELYNMALDDVNKRKIMYEETQKNGSREELIIADTYYRNSQENLIKVKAKFDLSRTILENLTGKEALGEIEKSNQ
ncbi:MAG: hypothetical protein Q4F80_03980 [bacterium]|nr:hypothetical protein [bacterium]